TFQSKYPSNDVVTDIRFANDETKPNTYEIAAVPSAADTTPPKIVSVFPANRATNIPLIVDISVKFSEPMLASTLSGATIKLKDNFNNVLPSTIRSPDVDTAVLRPSSPLSPSKLYSVIVTQGVKDLAGNAMSTPLKWIFSTTQTSSDTPPPTTPGKQILSDAQKKLLQGAGSPPSNHPGQAATDIDKPNAPTIVYLTLHFDSVDIINEHEGFLSGDGEYDLWAEAGKGITPAGNDERIDLNAHAVADGLWDVSSHERVPFEDYYNHIYSYEKSDLTKDSNFRIAFHLKTYGYEVDGCGRMYGRGGETAKGFYQCQLGDDNDRLGDIKFSQTFDWPTEFGESGKKEFPFHASSSSGDYRLNFRITIEARTLPKG